jgi:hypothetical protein
MQLNKGKITLLFDKVFKTDTGKVVGVELLPRNGRKGDGYAFPTTDDSDSPPAVPSTPTTPESSKKSWNINRMHQVFNHASEDVLRKIAKEQGWNITGKFETCKDCKESNAKQKNVSKVSDSKSDIPGERLFIDITSIKDKSIGGSKFWLVIVDDATNLTWSMFLKQKNHTAKHLLPLLLQFRGIELPVKCIRCDNAGENKTLENKCKNHAQLCNIQFEYTPRDSPQYNGKVERKIAVLTSRVRSMLTAAGLPEKLRPQLWAEAGKTATDIENMLIPVHNGMSPYAAFNMPVLKMEHLKQFG